jgi:hypothetical protein
VRNRLTARAARLGDIRMAVDIAIVAFWEFRFLYEGNAGCVPSRRESVESRSS